MTVNVNHYQRVRFGKVEHVSAHNRADADYHQPINTHNDGYPELLGHLITQYIRKGYNAQDAVSAAKDDYYGE
jgi:hypothetical protein